jgi:hypothetical protein
MSVTTSQALAIVRAQVEAAGLSFPVYWQGEDAPLLRDDPATFAFVVFTNEGSGGRPAAYGGGRGANLYRSRAFLEAFVFVPSGWGLSAATDAAELVAASLRSFRSGDVSCFAADARPVGPGSGINVPGLSSVVSNYQCAVAEATLTFDQIG